MLFRSTAADNPLTEYPLFGQSASPIPWNTFVSSMNDFAIGDQASWCSICGNSTGSCASVSTTSSSPTPSTTGSSNGGVSKAVAGVIGAMVTLAVLLGLATLVTLLFGLRIVRKKTLVGAPKDREVVQSTVRNEL